MSAMTTALAIQILRDMVSTGFDPLLQVHGANIYAAAFSHYDAVHDALHGPSRKAEAKEFRDAMVNLSLAGSGLDFRHNSVPFGGRVAHDCIPNAMVPKLKQGLKRLSAGGCDFCDKKNHPSDLCPKRWH